MGSAPDADVGRAHPDLQLTSREVVTQLTWLGLLPLLLFKSHMKLSLSLHCIICAARFSSTMLLAGHLSQHHAAELRDAQEWTKMVAWVLFAVHGCVCNPATHHGVIGHFCPLQIQVAHIIRTSDLKVAIPWSFRATDLMDLLETSVPATALKKITALIMSRQFELLINGQEVLHLLTSRCVWCDEAVPIRQALAHLQVTHAFDIRNIKVIIDQLAAVATQTHDGFWCSYCGELLPSTEIAFDIAPQPEKHMPLCPYITMLAVLLSYPMWHRSAFDPDVWPSTDEVERAYHSLHQRRQQFNVSFSDPPDTFGAAFELLAECGLDMLNDPQQMLEIRYKCLMCHKCFYMPGALQRHVQSHNTRQLDTQFCMHRLQLRCLPQCQFCDAPTSSRQQAHRCPALLNLAVFLTHGSAGTNGSSQRYLAGDLDPCTDRGSQCADTKGTTLQTAQAGLFQYFNKRIKDGHVPTDGAAGQTGSEDRIEPECSTTRTSVSDPHQSRPGLHLASDVGGHKEVACFGQKPSIETCTGGSDDGDTDAPRRAPSSGEPQRRGLEGSGEDALDQRRWTNAVPSMGPDDSNAPTDKGCFDVDSGMSTGSAELDPTDKGSHNDITIPCSDKAEGSSRSLHSMAVATVQSQPTRSLGGSTAIVLSRHLAAYPLPNQASEHREDASGQADTEASARRVVRILLNHRNMCYINSFIISLAWVTLLMQGLELEQWPMGGFELFRTSLSVVCRSIWLSSDPFFGFYPVRTNRGGP